MRTAPTAGEHIVIAGERFAIHAPVVLWTTPGGYDATSTQLAFPATPPDEPPKGLRYQPGRAELGAEQGAAESAAAARSLAHTREIVDQFVLHYDAAGTSRACFRTLHDLRKLSVHFLLDLDGTLYQTMDLADTAWHATRSNRRSVGIEIANIGAFAPGQRSPADEWYVNDERGVRVNVPIRLGEAGQRMQSFVPRPARPRPVRGTIQGQTLEMWDLTPAQYESLARLAAGLSQALPKLRLEVPCEQAGVESSPVASQVLDDAQWERFQGVLGHYHVQANKVDPGPAFDWERFLRRARFLAAHPEKLQP